MGLRLALCLMAALPALATPVSAQTLLGVTLGDPIPETMPAPFGTQVQAPFSQTLWRDIDGIALSAISDVETGQVLFLEARPAQGQTVAAPTLGLTFGETTRDDLHARFGSEGMVFADIGRAGLFDETAVYFTTYEIAGSDTVVSFTTIQPLDVASDETAGASTLGSIVVAHGSYLAQVWGLNRGRLPGYGPIADPFQD